jgi:hypothetical protein
MQSRQERLELLALARSVTSQVKDMMGLRHRVDLAKENASSLEAALGWWYCSKE